MITRSDDLVKPQTSEPAPGGYELGRPQCILPHTADQPFWAARMQDLGISKSIRSVKNLTCRKLLEIDAFFADGETNQRSRRIADEIKAEDGVRTAVTEILRTIDAQKFHYPSDWSAVFR